MRYELELHVTHVAMRIRSWSPLQSLSLFCRQGILTNTGAHCPAFRTAPRRVITGKSPFSLAAVIHRQKGVKVLKDFQKTMCGESYSVRKTSPTCNEFVEKNVIFPRLLTCASPPRAVCAGYGRGKGQGSPGHSRRGPARHAARVVTRNGMHGGREPISRRLTGVGGL